MNEKLVMIDWIERKMVCRTKMIGSLFAVGLTVYLGAAAFAGDTATLRERPDVPSYLKGYKDLYGRDPHEAALRWFKDAKFGLFVHYALASVLERGKPEYLEAATAVNISLEQMEISTKTILDVQGVSVATMANYLAFARELWKKSRQYSAEALAVEANTTLQKWLARGMSQSVLEAIRFGVFGISAPAGP